MNKKGQIFSLDFLIAAGIVLLGLALTINAMETTSFNTQEQFYLEELRYVAMTASDRFVSSASPCIYNDEIHVKNCVYLNPLVKIGKNKLGIPDEYDYMIEDTIYFIGFNPALPTNKTIHSITRIYLKSTNSTVDDLSNLEVKEITFKVWKK
jgi:hypothetical protein